MKSLEELKAIVARFDVKGEIQEIKPLGNGLINDTLLVKTDGPDNYVLQRVNNAIFKDVDLLQHNIDLQSVSSRMGHSNPSVTLRAYADAMPARDQEAAAAMDALLLSADPSPDLPPDPSPET